MNVKAGDADQGTGSGGDAEDMNRHHSQLRGGDEQCSMLRAMVRSAILDGDRVQTDQQWVAELNVPRGPPRPIPECTPAARRQKHLRQALQKIPAGKQLKVNLLASSTRKVALRQGPAQHAVAHHPGKPPRRVQTSEMPRTTVESAKGELARALRARGEKMPPAHKLAAIDMALSMRSTLEAEGFTSQAVTDGAAEVLAGLLRQ